jgi:predicted enzyme related to lactoylglutathione lyase
VDEQENYADLDTGAVGIALFSRPLMAEAVGTAGNPSTSDAQSPAALIFAVDDVDATVAQLEAMGVVLVTPPMDRPDWGIRTAHFYEPDRNLLEINQPHPR